MKYKWCEDEKNRTKKKLWKNIIKEDDDEILKKTEQKQNSFDKRLYIQSKHCHVSPLSVSLSFFFIKSEYKRNGEVGMTLFKTAVFPVFCLFCLMNKVASFSLPRPPPSHYYYCYYSLLLCSYTVKNQTSSK